MFIKFNDKIINVSTIKSLETDTLLSDGYISILYLNSYAVERVHGQEAIDIIMRLCPSAIEGKPVKFEKFRWAIHNLIGHPVMQILSFVGLTSLGLKIHDATVPNPKRI